MKTLISITAFVAMFCGSITAQTPSHKSSAPQGAKNDTILISSVRDGNYQVRRYVLRSQEGQSDYAVRYTINLATLQKNLDNNAKELSSLNEFMDKALKDTLTGISSIDVIGYASPDGPYSLNEKLSLKRAQDFKIYLEKNYNLSRYKVNIKGVAEDWETCRKMVVQDNVPNKQTVLNIIDSNKKPDTKEADLKLLPESWDYMKKNILPQLRRVDVAINYSHSNVIEERILIEKPKPKPTPKAVAVAKKADCCDCGEGIMSDVDQELGVAEEFEVEVIEVEIF